MPLYRIFTNNRGKKKGVPLYSALKPCRARDEATAIGTVSPLFGRPPLAPVKAIQWPPDDAGRAWLKEHVDAR